MEISIKAMLNTCKDSPELEIGLKPYDCGSWRGVYVEATDTLWLKLFQNPTFTQQLALHMEV